MIILDAPAGKSPGPDGIPSSCLKIFGRQLVPIFQEAWTELCNGETSSHIGMRKWTVFPKEDGANTVAKLRDIEAY